MSFLLNILSFLRYENWIKNLLIFIPFLLTNDYNLIELKKLVISFISFSLVASAGYIVNDLNDADLDRKHVLKKERPIASGKISYINAYFSITLLLFISSTMITQSRNVVPLTKLVVINSTIFL
mgnify:CR=1 FL=1